MPSSPSDPNQTVDESAAPSGGEDPGSGRERAAAVHELRRDSSPLALAGLRARIGRSLSHGMGDIGKKHVFLRKVVSQVARLATPEQYAIQG